MGHDATSDVRSCVPGSAVVRFDVGFDRTTKRGKWLLHAVVVAMNVRECGYFWHYLRLAKEI